MKNGRREWLGKRLNDVDIRDDFMFSYIMRDPELCLGLLRQLLPDCPIERIEYVELEAEKQQLEKALGTRLETKLPTRVKQSTAIIITSPFLISRFLCFPYV